MSIKDKNVIFNAWLNDSLISSHLLFFKKQMSNATVYKVHTVYSTHIGLPRIKCYSNYAYM